MRGDRVFLAFLFLSLTFYVQSQDIKILTGKILNLSDSSGVENALIKTYGAHAYSNVSGLFELRLLSKTGSIEILHPGYQARTIKLKPDQTDLGTIYLKSTGAIAQVEITARASNTFRGVIDFEVVDDRLLVLTFKGGKQLFELHELIPGFPKVAVLRDMNKSNGLLTDCLGRVFAVNDKYASLIHIENDSLVNGSPVEINQFMSFYNACLIADSNYQLYRDFQYFNKGLAIVGVNQHDNSEKTVTYSLDTNGYIFAATLAQDIADIVASLSPTASRNSRVQQNRARAKELFDLNALLRTVSLGENYLPAFRVKDDWWLLDHHGDHVLVVGRDSLNTKDKFSISYQHQNFWSQPVIQADNQELYLKFQQKNGTVFLKHFDVNRREVAGAPIQLKKNYPEKICITRGNVIYTAKNGEGYFQLNIEPIEKATAGL